MKDFKLVKNSFKLKLALIFFFWKFLQDTNTGYSLALIFYGHNLEKFVFFYFNDFLQDMHLIFLIQLEETYW